MKTLDDYLQSDSFEDKISSIEDTIDNLDIPKELKTKFKSEIEDNRFEIGEHNYKIFESDYEDYVYEQQKESKYFTEDI